MGEHLGGQALSPLDLLDDLGPWAIRGGDSCPEMQYGGVERDTVAHSEEAEHLGRLGSGVGIDLLAAQDAM